MNNLISKLKLSACILSRNDSTLIEKCILHVAPYMDEIVILDSSDDDSTVNLVKSMGMIEGGMEAVRNKIVIKQKKGEKTQDFSKERNEVQGMATGDYVLHVDCDERFDENLLSQLKDIIDCYLRNGVLPVLFRFPRLNQPDNVNYPDYQIRLLNRKCSMWEGSIHEVPTVLESELEGGKLEGSVIGGLVGGLAGGSDGLAGGVNVINLLTIDCPITHLYKDKTKVWERWDTLMDAEGKNRRLLVISLFKNSARWTKDMLKCFSDLYKYNRSLDGSGGEGRESSKLFINFSFVDGNSKDGTYQILDYYVKGGSILNIQLRKFESMENESIIRESTPDNLTPAQKFDPFNSPSYKLARSKKFVGRGKNQSGRGERGNLNVGRMEIRDSEKARFTKLANVRNLAIEYSVRGFNLGDNDLILFADSDIMFESDLVHKLVKDMNEFGADIIAPMIFVKEYRNFGNTYFYDSLAFRDISGKNFNHTVPYVVLAGGGAGGGQNMDVPFEVGSVGSFYLMKYKVVKDKNVVFTGNNDSEQVEFCNSARSRGFKVMVSPQLSAYHINFDQYHLAWH